jgi:hypothetical protein
MKIFVNDGGVLKLDREEIALIKEFNNLLRRNKPCNEDKDGNKKIMNFKEFNYVYCISDYSAYPKQKGLNDKESHAWAISNASLPNDWKPDELVKAAILKYQEVNMSAARELATETQASLHLATKLIKRLRENIEKELDNPDASILTQLVTNLEKIMDIAKALPSQIQSLQKVKELIDKEEVNVEQLRGGGEVYDSMNPENDIDTYDNRND